MGKVSNYLSGMSKSTKLGLVGALAFLGIAGAAAVANQAKKLHVPPKQPHQLKLR